MFIDVGVGAAETASAPAPEAAVLTSPAAAAVWPPLSPPSSPLSGAISRVARIAGGRRRERRPTTFAPFAAAGLASKGESTRDDDDDDDDDDDVDDALSVACSCACPPLIFVFRIMVGGCFLEG